MLIMSVDSGEARTGIAICDKTETLASPVCVITEYNFEKRVQKVCAKALELGAEHIVVGLPKNMDGSEGESAQAARAFGEMLKEKTELPLEFGDERGTTITAHGYLNNTDTRGKKRKNVVDAVAATIILEDYLRKRKNQNG